MVTKLASEIFLPQLQPGLTIWTEIQKTKASIQTSQIPIFVTKRKSLPGQGLVCNIGKLPCCVWILQPCLSRCWFTIVIFLQKEGSTKCTKSVPSVYFCFVTVWQSDYLFLWLKGRKKDKIILLEIQESFHSFPSLQLGFSLQAVKFRTASSVICSWLGQQAGFSVGVDMMRGRADRKEIVSLSLLSVVISRVSLVSAFGEGLWVLWDYFHSHFGGEVI